MSTAFHQLSRHPASRLLSAISLWLLAVLWLGGCKDEPSSTRSSHVQQLSQLESESSGEDFLISALDEILSVSDWSALPPAGSIHDTAYANRQTKSLLKTSSDTVYAYGETTSDGYGAVVTERFSHPKGLLLITVRKTHGKEDGHIVSQTKRYVSYEDLQDDVPQQENVTEIYGLAADTIVTHVLRNGSLETFTFRLPVVSRVVNPQDGSVRVTSRHASNGTIVSEIKDGAGNLVQLRRSYGQNDGSIVARTEFSDLSWRQVRTLGQPDGAVLREVTSSPASSARLQQAAPGDTL
ncbi:MAG: hypothetical protein WBD36_02405 [Bacteroidota bacterium]